MDYVCSFAVVGSFLLAALDAWLVTVVRQQPFVETYFIFNRVSVNSIVVGITSFGTLTETIIHRWHWWTCPISLAIMLAALYMVQSGLIDYFKKRLPAESSQQRGYAKVRALTTEERVQA